MNDDREAQTPPGGATWSETPGLAARGLCMGSADVVPGVSGGTMALVLGIYSRWIQSIKSFGPEALSPLLRGEAGQAFARLHWRFLGAVVFGQTVGVVLFTKVVPLPKLAVSHRELVYALFFGLIVGSAVVLGRQVRAVGLTGGRIAAGFAGLAAGVVVVNLSRLGDAPWTESPWFVFLCGCVSICAMVLPGISGSFVLLILHKYEYVLGGLGEFISPTGGGGRTEPFLQIVFPFALGCAVGIVAFSRLLSWLLGKAREATLSFMTGLMVGSLYLIWPFQKLETITVREKVRVIGSTPILPEAVDGQLAGVVVLAVVGCAGVVLIERLAGSQEKGAKPAPEPDA